MARKNTLEQKRGRRLQKQLTAYSVAAGAALALTNPADASIIYSGAQNITIDSTTPSYSIDLDGGGDDFYISANFLPSSAYFYATGLAGAKVRLQTAFSTTAKNFYKGESIVPGTANMWHSYGFLHGTYSGPGFGPFNDTQGYIGIQFGASQYLGWIKYEGDSNSPSGTILGWAYEDNPATPIKAGAVPLPGTFGLGLLSLGAAGVARLRQRKKEAKAETA